jgi:hypothetical protein
LTRLFISLPDDEAEALVRIAYAELRDPRAQAALIIRAELERRGLLRPTQDPVARDTKEGKAVCNYQTN